MSGSQSTARHSLNSTVVGPDLVLIRPRPSPLETVVIRDQLATADSCIIPRPSIIQGVVIIQLIGWCVWCVDAPKITAVPMDKKVVENGAVTFMCRASGHPTPDVFWRRAGRRIAANHQRYTVRAVRSRKSRGPGTKVLERTTSGLDILYH